MSQNLGSVYKRGRIWWVTYNVDGTQHRESSHGTRKGDANRLLAHSVSPRSTTGGLSDQRTIAWGGKSSKPW